jgi:hypothetical protein
VATLLLLVLLKVHVLWEGVVPPWGIPLGNSDNTPQTFLTTICSQK